MFRDEFVHRRKWLTDEQFLDLLGATNLIPGPNSTEMAIHLGYLRAGWAGLLLAGAGFILPAMLIVIFLAWAYGNFGGTPQADWLLAGIKPVVIAIIFQALWNLGRKAIRDLPLALVGLGAVALYFLGMHPIPVLLAGGLLILAYQGKDRLRALKFSGLAAGLISNASLAGSAAGAAVAASVPFSLSTLFLTFLKIGAVLYGSGYVLLAFLRADFVERLGWLTESQLIDAIAIGQITPGPVFTSAAFIGYILGGVPAAIIATLGIFLPSFFFVAISNPLIPRLRQSPWTASILDGVNAASLGLMAAVTIQLAGDAFPDLWMALVGIASAVLLIRYQVNTTWLILGGAGFGLLRSLLGF
jgi:chromate transporter